MAFQAGVIEGQLRIDGKQFQIFARQVNTAQKQMAGQAGTTGGAFKGMWKQMAVGLGIAGGVALAIRAINNQFKDTIRKGREFEKEWANVTTMLSISERETRKMKDELLKLSPTLGDTTDLAKGMYQVLSASIEPAKAIEFLGESAKSAKAGVTDTKTAVDALTTVINAYGMEAEDVTDVSDIMFQTVKRGKLTYEELAHSLGTCVTPASEVGVGFKEVAAAVATMTRRGIDAQTATMQLRQVFMSILGASDEVKKYARDLGFEFSATALKTKGLSGFMKDLRDATGGNSEIMKKFVQNVRALNAVMVLAGESATDFRKDLDLMEQASGSTEEAFQKQMKSMDFWMDTATVTVDKLKIAFYEGLVTPFKEGIETSADLEERIDSLIDKFGKLGIVVGKLMAAGLDRLIKKMDQADMASASLDVVLKGLTKTLKDKQKPTLDNIVKAWLALKEETEKYNWAVEHLEKWLSLTNEKTKEIIQTTYGFGDALEDARKAIERIKFEKFQKDLEDIYDSLKDIEIAEEDLTDATEEAGTAWASVLDQTGIKIAGINVQAQTTFNSMAEFYDDLAMRWQATYLEKIQPTFETWGKLLWEFYGQIFKFCTDVDNSWRNMTDNMVENFQAWGEGTGNILKLMGETIGGFVDDVIGHMGRLLMEMVTETIKTWVLKQTQALASGIASVMKALPFPINVIAIGGMIAAVTALFAKIKKFEKGGRVPTRQIVEVAEREPEWIIPESRMGEFAQRYEKEKGGRSRRQAQQAQTVLQPIILNVDGMKMTRVVAKYSVELSREGHMQFHIRGLTDK